MHTTSSSALRRASLATLLLVSCAARAQYVWLDEKGGKHYSDRPPAANVPASRILKQPGGESNVTADAVKAPSDQAPAAPAMTAAQTRASEAAEPQTAAQRNAEFQKRRAEAQEKEKKAAEDGKRNADNAANCERMRAYEKTLASGERVRVPGPNGELVFVSDEQRTRELKDVRTSLMGCKKG